MNEGRPETIQDPELAEQEQLETIEQELASFLPESDVSSLGLTLPTEEELVAFPAEWETILPEDRARIDALIQSDRDEGLNGEVVGEEVAEGQLEAVILEEAEAIDKEAAEVLSSVSDAERPEAERKVKQFKRSKLAASLFAVLGVVGVAQNVEAGSRDIDLGRVIDKVLVDPEIRSQRQENSAEQRYENSIRSLQLRYNQQAGRIQAELSQLNDPNFIQLRERQADIKIEIQYNKRIAMAPTPAEKERLTVEREARKAEARVAQQLKDEQRKITLEQSLDLLDTKYDQAIQDAQMRYSSKLQEIQGQKAEKRSQEVGREIDKILKKVFD